LTKKLQKIGLTKAKITHQNPDLKEFLFLMVIIVFWMVKFV